MDRRTVAMRKQLRVLNESKKKLSVFDAVKNDLQHKRHRKDVMAMKCKVDASSPLVRGSRIFSSLKLKSDRDRIEGRMKANLHIVSLLNRIHRTKGKVDSHNPLAAQRVTLKPNRLAEQKHIAMMNQLIFRNLSRVEATPETCKRRLNDNWELFHRPDIIRNTKFATTINSLMSAAFDCNLHDPPSYQLYKISKIVFFDFHMKASEKEKETTSLGRVIVMLECKNKKLSEAFASQCESFEGRKVQKIIPAKLFEVGEVNPAVLAELYEARKGNHDYPGTLSLSAPTNKLSITVDIMPSLDGTRIVLGRVIKGLDVLQAIDSFGSRCGLPKRTIFIKKCGILKKTFQE